jgi:hypothetical protein
MPDLISTEATQNLQSPLDIENFGQRWKTSNNYFTFPDPNLLTLDKNLYYLLRHSEEIKFNGKYKYRPDYLSYDYYGTVMLWEMLLYVNNVFSLEDFDLNTVVIPSFEAVTFILQDSFQIPDSEDLQSIDW